MQLAVLKFPPTRHVASALTRLGLKTCLPAKLVLPFYASVWKVVVLDNFHALLATKLVEHFQLDAGDFTTIAVAASLSDYKVQEMDNEAWSRLLDFLHCVARVCPRSVPWKDCKVQNVLCAFEACRGVSPNLQLKAVEIWIMDFIWSGATSSVSEVFVFTDAANQQKHKPREECARISN